MPAASALPTLQRIFAGLALAVCCCATSAAQEESNFWPGPVARFRADGSTESWTALGPLFFSEPSPAGGRVAGFRPFYVERLSPAGERTGFTVLYPIFYNYENMTRALIASFDDHDGVRRLLHEIDLLPASSPELKSRIAELEAYVNHHATEEETLLFPLIRQVMKRSEREMLGRRLEAVKLQSLEAA